uniref:Lon protease homolog n=1 Tax=Karlodinium veneficum TaxID=407301 RepID=F2WQ74_KARVE|nr:mitochondrial lon protease-like protein 2 [Karlodinium veneficum]
MTTTTRDNVFILTLRQQMIFPAIRTSITIQPSTFQELCEFCEKYDSTHIGVVAMQPGKGGDAPEEPYSVGTYCRIGSHSQSTTKTGDQDITVVTLSIEGQSRFQVLKYTSKADSPYRLARINILDEKEAGDTSAEVKALMQNVEQNVMELLKEGSGSRNGESAGGPLKNLFGSNRQKVRWPSSPSVLADMIGAGLPSLSIRERQHILETFEVKKRLELALELVQKEVEVQKLSREISNKAQMRTKDELRETVLRRQLQELQRELRKVKGKGESSSEIDEEDGEDDEEEDDILALKEALKKCNLSADAKKIAAREMKRLQNIQPQHPEHTVCRTYLETLSNSPWSESTKDDLDLVRAREILEKDHYGLEKVKMRILEYLAVQKLRGNMKGPILCLHGPPGVGKTSLGRSIAKALGRKFHRLALGGVRDEAELRGHRRTYIGSMPGSIIQAMIQMQVNNPVILLDEIDKVTQNPMHNPSGALLELLDPEQNNSFKDHYVNTPFDLSNVLFLCTCNDLNTTDRPLLDRMEVIDLSGYTVEEKVHIATTHLFPKQRKLHALEAPDPEETQVEDIDGGDAAGADAKADESEEVQTSTDTEALMLAPEKPLLTLTDVAIADLISKWTKESGVRNLERRLAQVCRWAALRVTGAQSQSGKAFAAAIKAPEVNERDRLAEVALAECGPDATGNIVVDAHHLPHIVGAELFEPDLAERLSVGVAMGLSVSAVGGQLLFIEAARSKGSGKLTITGKLGDVMRESVETSMSLLRSKLYLVDEPAVNEVFQQLFDQTDQAKDPFKNDNIHVHFPAGAIPKDGPSAGVATTLALASLLLNRPVRSDTAVTGEISLRGHVLPVGGVRDKVLAAHRAGVQHVLLPLGNERNVKDELPASTLNSIEIHYVKNIDEALAWAFADNVKSFPVPVSPPDASQAPAFTMMSKL